jgi:hypothetical protein
MGLLLRVTNAVGRNLIECSLFLGLFHFKLFLRCLFLFLQPLELFHPPLEFAPHVNATARTVAIKTPTHSYTTATVCAVVIACNGAATTHATHALAVSTRTTLELE